MATHQIMNSAERRSEFFRHFITFTSPNDNCDVDSHRSVKYLIEKKKCVIEQMWVIGTLLFYFCYKTSFIYTIQIEFSWQQLQITYKNRSLKLN